MELPVDGLENAPKFAGTAVGVAVLLHEVELTADGLTICDGEVGTIPLANVMPSATPGIVGVVGGVISGAATVY